MVTFSSEGVNGRNSVLLGGDERFRQPHSAVLASTYACEEAREAIKKAKAESWKEVLEDAINGTDERKMWTFIKSLNVTPDNNSPNEVMKHKGVIISSNN